MTKYYDYDNPKFGKSTKYIYGDEPKTSYGATVKNTHYNLEDPDQNIQSTNYSGAFCKTVLIIHGFFLFTASIFFLIDLIVNNDLYMQSSAYKELIFRDAYIILIILSSWYLLLIPILIIVLYNKKHNTACYRSACRTDSVLCCCECLVDLSDILGRCAYMCYVIELL